MNIIKIFEAGREATECRLKIVVTEQENRLKAPT
jgi:hypothetical protein